MPRKYKTKYVTGAAKIVRDSEIRAKYFSGTRVADLTDAYNLTPAGIYQILAPVRPEAGKGPTHAGRPRGTSPKPPNKKWVLSDKWKEARETMESERLERRDAIIEAYNEGGSLGIVGE